MFSVISAFIHRHAVTLAAIFSLLLYFFALWLTKVDTAGLYRWIGFWSYLVSVITILGIFLRNHRDKLPLLKRLPTAELFRFGVLMILVTTVSLAYLKNYPYISVGDELRDGGLNAQQIVAGEMKDFFAYGSYNGFGHIIPVISSFFYRIFGPSVLTYRFPSALLYILEIGLFYSLLRLIFKNSWLAFLGSCAYAAIPLHIFFARTEIVVAFDSFWTVVILLAFYIWLQTKSSANTLLLGTILGMASQFHTAVRIIALFIMAFTFLFKSWPIHIITPKKWLRFVAILVIAFLIGLGPTLLYSNSQTFLQKSRFGLNNQSVQEPFQTRLAQIETKYLKSLMVWFYEPTTFFYPVNKPLLPPLLASLFLLGLGYSVFRSKDSFLCVLLFLVFMIPFTNSAMTDTINADHRLTVLLPVGIIFVTLGIAWLLQSFQNSFIRSLIAGGILVYLLILLIGFFTSYSAGGTKDSKDYLAMHLVYFLQSKKSAGCVVVSPTNYTNLNLRHYKEQFNYFLSHHPPTITSDTNIPDNEAYVMAGECQNNYQTTQFQSVTSCTQKPSFYCPPKYTENIIIHY